MRSKPRRLKRKAQQGRRAIKALAAGAAIAAGTQAYAAPVRFDNPAVGQPGHFQWDAGNQYNRALYISLPSGQQGNQSYSDDYGGFVRGRRSFARTAETNDGYGHVTPAWVQAGLFNTGMPSADILTDTGEYGNAWGFSASDAIPGTSAHWARNPSYGDAFGKVRNPSTGASLIPEGVPAYLGVRISNLAGGAGWHYGWIGVIRNAGNLQAFAWGYETDLGTPIPAGIPEPGSLALLALGAGAVVVRKR
jgi:hypothetical protein